MGQAEGRSIRGALGGVARNGGTQKRRQQAGFSVFLDQIVDESGDTHWETRLYHAESGAETTLPGASPDQWIGWILDRMRPVSAEDLRPESGTSRAAVEVVSVEILDVTFVGDDAPGSEPLQALKAQLVVQLTGVAELEREIGSRVLRGLADPNRNRPADH